MSKTTKHAKHLITIGNRVEQIAGEDVDLQLGAEVKIDVDKLIRTKALIQGNSGAGKSGLIRVIVEQIAAKIPTIIIDPESEFASLREKLDMVLVGHQGELAADVRSAGLLARKLAEMGASAILDIYELKGDQRHQFVRNYLEAQIDLPRTLWRPTVVVIDEAQLFAPEKGFGDSLALEAIMDWMFRQRKHGIGSILATPRLSMLNNNARKINEPFQTLASTTRGLATASHHKAASVPHARPRALASPSAPRNLTATPSDLKISRTQQRILDALAWYESIRINEPTNIQVGAIALIDATGGHFSNNVGPLSSAGLIIRGSGTMRLTEEGHKFAAVPEQIATLEDYHDVLRKRVRQSRNASGRTVEVLNVIIAKNGESITNEEIGQSLNPPIDHTGGHFSNTIGPLSTLGFITRNQGVNYPTDVLFPPGL